MDTQVVTSIAGIVVAGVAALSAYASQRAASKASVQTSSDSSRVESEKGAYERARAMDTETINRLDNRVNELETENADLRRQLNQCSNRLYRLEQKQ